MAWGTVRNTTATWQANVEQSGWGARLAISVGLGAFLGLMATISFPVPWTPVPFSLAPLAVLVVGAYQRPAWALLSVVLYLLAGAVGAPIYAEGASGWSHLAGSTSGYMLGYGVVAVFASWYMQQRRRLMPTPWATAVLLLVGALVVGGVAAMARMAGSGQGFAAYGERYDGWRYGASMVWLFAFLTVACAALSAWTVLRVRGQARPALNLFLLFLGAIGLLHVMGVAGLVAIAGMPLVTAVIVGSVVFLPFDIVKAGLAVAATLPFLPAPAGVPADATADKRSHA